jgi:hypothetical protein
MATWEGFWELEFPFEKPEELLLGLVVKDLLHGSSYDVEIPDGGEDLAIDYVAGDEVEDRVYRLLMSASVEGEEDRKALREITEQVLEEILEEAAGLVAKRKKVGAKKVEEIAFRAVAEDQERWDLVVPDWLAPDGAEVPFGFRPFLVEGEDPWPADGELDQHGRLVLVPDGVGFTLYGIPAPSAPAEES